MVQLGFAVLLTIVAATMARSLARLRSVDLGFKPDSVFVARLSLPPQKYQRVDALSRFARAFEQGLRTTPGVVAAGGISIAPLSGVLSIIPLASWVERRLAGASDLRQTFARLRQAI